MTQEEYLKIKDGLDEAEESVTPFAIVEDDAIAVVGDANETELNTHDFKIKFRIPTKGENGVVQYTIQEIEYNDIYVTPRQDIRVVKLLNQLLPYFRKPTKDGKVTKYTKEESSQIMLELEDEIYDRMYDLVAAVLGVDKILAPLMTVGSVMEATLQIVKGYPELVNEADTFFG